MDNYIYAYYQQIKDGTVLVGRWVRLLYENIIQALEDGVYLYDPDKANDAVEWIEKYCHHTEGPLAPDNIKLELWQKAALSVIFGIVDADGLRIFREIVLVVARKNGKTSLIAALAWAMAILQRKSGSTCYIVANAMKQALQAFNFILFSLQYSGIVEQFKVINNSFDHSIEYIFKK